MNETDSSKKQKKQHGCITTLKTPGKLSCPLRDQSFLVCRSPKLNHSPTFVLKKLLKIERKQFSLRGSAQSIPVTRTSFGTSENGTTLEPAFEH